MACGCDGGAGSAATSSSGGGGWTIRLHNGAHVGVFPTRAAGEQELKRTYNSAGTVVQR